MSISITPNYLENVGDPSFSPFSKALLTTAITAALGCLLFGPGGLISIPPTFFSTFNTARVTHIQQEQLKKNEEDRTARAKKYEEEQKVKAIRDEEAQKKQAEAATALKQIAESKQIEVESVVKVNESKVQANLAIKKANDTAAQTSVCIKWTVISTTIALSLIILSAMAYMWRDRLFQSQIKLQ